MPMFDYLRGSYIIIMVWQFSARISKLECMLTQSVSVYFSQINIPFGLKPPSRVLYRGISLFCLEFRLANDGGTITSVARQKETNAVEINQLNRDIRTIRRESPGV